MFVTFTSWVLSRDERQFNTPAIAGFGFLFVVLTPAYGVLVHYLRGDNVDGNPFLFLGTYLHFIAIVAAVVLCTGYRFFFNVVVALLGVLSVVVWLIYAAGITLGADVVNQFGYEHSIYTYGDRVYLGLTLPNVYYYTSPMIVLGAAYWIYRVSRERRSLIGVPHLMSVITIGALGLSGTRASLAISVVLVFVLARHYSRPLTYVLGVGALGAVMASFNDFVALFGVSGSTVDGSNVARIGLIDQAEIMFRDIPGLVFGFGLGSCMQSPSRGICMPVTEFTYLDQIRFFGALIGVLYIALIVWPWAVLRRRSAVVSSMYLAYILSAAFNPYIFSSIGALVVALAITGAWSLSPIPGERVTARNQLDADLTTRSDTANGADVRIV